MARQLDSMSLRVRERMLDLLWQSNKGVYQVLFDLTAGTGLEMLKQLSLSRPKIYKRISEKALRENAIRLARGGRLR